jgi:adenine deaminase
MILDKTELTTLIKASSGEISCDLVLKNGHIVDVFSGEVIEVSLAIKNGYIIGYGDDYIGNETLDLKGKTISPSLMDSHIHIESTLATPKEFSKAAIRHGITSVVMDPHEIANVLGVDGIKFMLESSKNLPVDFFAMMSSCVPATSFESSGAILKANSIKPFYADSRVLGLAEVMDLYAVKSCDDDMLQKLLDARNRNLAIDGHGSGLEPKDNNIFRVAGIMTDHECTTIEEAKDRLSKGFYIHIREGSVAKNYDALFPLINKNNLRRFTFCTDDIYINDLNDLGSIDTMVRKSIKNGLDPVDAIRIASLNPAECYGFRDRGAIAPGYKADFIILDSLEDFTLHSVYKDGKLVSNSMKLEFDFNNHVQPQFENTVHLTNFTIDDLKIPTNHNELNVIGIEKNSLLTTHEKIYGFDGNEFRSDPSRDLCKIFVIERHGNSGNIGKGIVTGFNLKHGAVATTIAHDSHNIVAMGIDDQDIFTAVKRLDEIGGGIVLVSDGKILAELDLKIAGLLSIDTLEVISEKLANLNAKANELFMDLDFNPFLTMSFLTLPVIPELKITDQGMFSLKKNGFISVDESR